MPSFLHPALFWTLGLPTLGVVALPVLIHLINMMRHRRLEWAAMEFLLVSQKKHRTWVILKQLLLLLLRMAAVAAVVLMVAQPRLHSQVADLLGGTRTHHIVLLDDSFSMSDRWADTDAFSEAKKVVDRIGDQRRQARSASVVHVAAVFAGAAAAAARGRARFEQSAGHQRVRRQAGGAAAETQGHAVGRRARAGLAGGLPSCSAATRASIASST